MAQQDRRLPPRESRPIRPGSLRPELGTGNSNTAEQALAETLAELGGYLSKFRNATTRQAWLATHIRERCLKNTASALPAAPRLLREDSDTGEKPEILKIEAFLLAQRFHM